MHSVDIAIGVGWVAFWIYWLAAAAGSKAGTSPLGRFAAVRLGIVVVVFIMVRAGVFKGHAVTNDPWLIASGVVIWLAGLALAIWARLYLGRNWGMPMSEKAEPELVTTGPYSRVRHPIYSGIILAMAGTAVAISPYWLIVTALLGAYFVYAALVEEGNMARLLPEQYPRYKQSTKMLVPFVF